MPTHRLKNIARKVAGFYRKDPRDKYKSAAHASTTYGGMGERELQLRLEMIIDLPNKDLPDLFEAAKALTQFGMADQSRFLNAAQSLGRVSTQIAHNFCRHSVVALKHLDSKAWQTWLAQVETLAEQGDLQATLNFLAATDDYVARAQALPSAAILDQVRPVIEYLLTGLGRGQLKIAEGQELYTDTDTIFLPAQCAYFETVEKNFQFYKLATAYLWAQTWFGTWRIDIPRMLYEQRDPERAVAVFQTLETIRLTRCLARALPGMARLERALYTQPWQPPRTLLWQRALERLSDSEARASDSVELLDSFYQEDIPPLYACHGVFKPERVYRAVKNRSDYNQAMLQQMLEKLRTQLQQQTLALKHKSGPFTLQFYEHALTPDEYDFVLSLDGETIDMPEEMRELFEQLGRDLGHIPPQLLNKEDTSTVEAPAEQAAPEQNSEWLLPEWDHATQKYRKDWCCVQIAPLEEGNSAFAAHTLAKHYGIISRLNRTFEALRNDDKLLRRQANGDEIDLDAVVEGLVAARASHLEMDENIFTKINKEERDVAVMFVVDMSASTRGWVNRLEKEALLLLCESLEILGDHYALYGFNGHTCKKCNIYPLKRFDESYGEVVQRRISGMEAGLYTRIGAALRYLSMQLDEHDAKTKVLIVLSDGKPDDSDGYRDRYGIEDTRQALLEIRRRGIHPHCITIDKEGADYLPYMYGHTRFSMISETEKLPFRMAEIYQQITC